MRRSVNWHASSALALACTLSLLPQTALAQDGSGALPNPVPASTATGTYAPDYFTRFAPRNALDMLVQVPGFSIREQAEQRGLGQATGNVLVNGERLSSKSEGIEAQLARIPSSKVVRIEILDGAALDIPGLTGQVANIVTESAGLSGQFQWEPQLATDYADFRWSQGQISISGDVGIMDFTLSLANEPFRGGTGGGTRVTDAAGELIEWRTGDTKTINDYPEVAGQFRFGLPGEVVANLNLSHQWNRADFRLDEIRHPLDRVDSAYTFANRTRGHEYEINGDLEFPLGPGRLKVIGLESYESFDRSSTERFDFVDASPPVGTRFEISSESGERIARAEYSWPMLSADWQLSGEAAFNRLDNIAGLFALDPDGAGYSPIPFPAASGGVREDRYEGLLSYGRSLGSDLSFQAIAGGEYSRIAQTGTDAEEREFWRPKGSIAVAWAPGGGFDTTLKLAREVGQLDFNDFLADVNLANDNSNASNNQLVPEQYWLVESVSNKDLGDWGSASIRLFYRKIQDLVTIVPLPGGLEGVGNVDDARELGLDLTATVKFDPLGFEGAKLDVLTELRDSNVVDPVVRLDRPLDELNGRNVTFDFRHDIPDTDLAWGWSVRNTAFGRYYRLAEIGKEHDVVTFGAIFVEHKDVFGLTLRARMANIFDGGSTLDRTVYAGPRGGSPVLFNEYRHRKIGLVWNFTVKGNF